MRTLLAVIATLVLGTLAALNLVIFGIVLVTKVTILFSGWAPLLSVVIFGANGAALCWLAAQTWKPVSRRLA